MLIPILDQKVINPKEATMLATLRNFPSFVTSTPEQKESIMNELKQFIIDSCNERAGNLNPCIKQQVYAMLITESGVYFGANWMLNDITVCPRVAQNVPSGTGYELCASVCGQGPEYHAERQAMTAAIEAGDTLEGATLYLTGHTFCCKYCREAMNEAGLKSAHVIDSGKEYFSISNFTE